VRRRWLLVALGAALAAAALYLWQGEIGFRQVAVRGREILLNGAPIQLRGISLHEEAPHGGGRAHSREHAETSGSGATARVRPRLPIRSRIADAARASPLAAAGLG
jgi:hypothetical protein